MDEQKDKAKEQEAANADTSEGDQSTTNTLLDRADATAKRLEDAKAGADKIIRQYQNVLARQALGGRSEAGQPEVKEPEVSPKEYAQLLIEGKLPLK